MPLMRAASATQRAPEARASAAQRVKTADAVASVATPVLRDHAVAQLPRSAAQRERRQRRHAASNMLLPAFER